MTAPDDNRDFSAEQNPGEPATVSPEQSEPPGPPLWRIGWATLTIIGINVAVFILMALDGVNVFLPETQELIDWGANLKPLTLDGQWWRLLTACFLHIGVLHLAVNMYALLNIGVALENMLGRAQYVIAYLVSGLAGSAVSVWWHEATVSAGASGAIFGMFGLFYAWVTTTHRLTAEEKKAQLASAGTFLALNLFMGLSGKVDLAGHVGGLLAGIVIGLLVSKWPSRTSWRPVLAGCALALAASALLVANSKSRVKDFQDKMREFSTIEETVNRMWQGTRLVADSLSAVKAFEECSAEWAKATAIAREVQGYELPDNMHAFTVLLADYCEKRGGLLDLKRQEVVGNSITVQHGIDSLNHELDKLNSQIEALTK